jgi:hypothetical protein
MIMEAGRAHCGGDDPLLTQALGQMQRIGHATAELEAASAAVDWPGKGDESPYVASEQRFRRYDAPAWPDDCPRGSYYPTGEGAVCVSETPVLDPSECAWVVESAQRTAREAWMIDIGKDKIWDKPFPDRLWLREIPGVLDWFEHRLRTRLFPMLQSLYPEVIPHPDCLRCHDAFISRYDANGMANLEVHQDTTDFTFTISINPQSEYDGGGTIFPSLRHPDLRSTNEPFSNTVVNPDVGCIASFPGRLMHGGNAITSGQRYIIPLFIYLDVNKLSGKPRGYLLSEAGIPAATPSGLDAASCSHASE